MARKLKRELLAERVAKAIAELTGCPVRGVVLRPAQGAWRTDERLDVYRWEGYGEISYSKGERWIGFSVDSWDTMTRSLRYGFTIEGAHRRSLAWEVHSKEPVKES